MKYFEEIHSLNEYYKIDLKHPLVDIRRYSDIINRISLKKESFIFGFYRISFIENFNGYIKYSGKEFKNKKCFLSFVEPGQRYSCFSDKSFEGYQILLHTDIFKKYLTEKNISKYNFFSYDINELLILSKEEENNVNYLMYQAWNEFNLKKDDFSISIILSYITSLLKLSERFYYRQFKSRKKSCNQISSGFFKILKTYYSDSKYIEKKQPTLSFLSEKLNITPNYLSDTIRHHTGKSALNIIQEFIIKEAKILLTKTNKSISEISYSLGFEYPNYFSRLFKRKTKFSPTEYRRYVKNI